MVIESLFIGIGIVVAYLIGSIPTSVWFGKMVFGQDVREHGSGNPGATNTFRVLGKRAGTIVLLADVTKGLLAASLGVLILRMDIIRPGDLEEFKLLFGLFGILGHVFPLYLNFKGGKGVATLMGMMLSVHWIGAFLALLVFLIVLLLSKYVSLGSMLGTLSFPLFCFIPRFSPDSPIIIIFGFILFAFIAITHYKNIIRLLQGEENKTYLIKKNK